MTDPVPILLTKLRPPVPRRNTFRRERLEAAMRQCVERRLTLITAGMGYGKTTLMAGTLAGMATPRLWYSLSRSDRDLVAFYSYLAEGFDRLWPGFANAVRPSFTGARQGPIRPEAFVAACVNQLESLAPGDFVVVLDDFQLVDPIGEICQTLDQFLLYAPERAHFVVATRAVPPTHMLPSVPRLRAQGEVLEIGEADLRFTPAEASAVFADCLELDLPEPQPAALVEQTEGWALGLLMAGQSLKGHGRLPEHAVDRQVLFEYLSAEVMRQQPSDLQDFLTSSSILSRLEPSLCDAALGRSDSARHLERLERHCLFVVRTEDGWLRYHRLFREFLQHALAHDPERLEALHRRAAAHFEETHDLEAAIGHRLEAGDRHVAAQWIAGLSEDMLRAGRFEALSYWLSRLSEAEFAEFPELRVRQGQMSESLGQWDEALWHCDQAAQSFTARGDLLGLSDVLRRKGHILDWRKGQHEEAERLHREALGYVGEQHRRARAALLASLARDQLSAGHTTAAQTLYREALAIHEAEGDRLGQLETLLNPGSWLYHSLGDFLQAMAVLRRAERLALELDHARLLAESHNNMSVNLYFLGRHAEALAYAEKALALSRQTGDAHQEAFALMNQAGALEMTCGAPYSDLHRQLRRALHVEQSLGDRRFNIAMLVYMAGLARRGGDLVEAVRRSQQALASAQESGLTWLEGFARVQLGAAYVWVDSALAMPSLEGALRIFGDLGDLYHLTATHFWLAVLLHSEDDPAHLEHLRECLKLAVGQHYDNLFLAEAQAAVPLLVAALERDLWPSYVMPLLVRIGPRAAGSLRPLLAHSEEKVRQRAQSVLAEISPGAPQAASRAHSGNGGRREAADRSVPPLTIRCFGHFGVWRGPHLVEEREWGRRKCKRLLRYLAVSPDHMLTKDALVELLWSGADPESANANFYRTLYNLRRVLEPMSPHSCANYLALEGGLVRLVPEALANVDVDEFTRGVEAGRRLARANDSAAAHEALSNAVLLYADDLCTDDLYDDWLGPRRDELLDLYLGALNLLSDLANSDGHPELALSYLRQAFRKDSTREAACLRLMQALATAGQRAEALQHYTTCEDALAELGLSPTAQLLDARRALLAVPTSASSGA